MGARAALIELSMPATATMGSEGCGATQLTTCLSACSGSGQPGLGLGLGPLEQVRVRARDGFGVGAGGRFGLGASVNPGPNPSLPPNPVSHLQLAYGGSRVDVVHEQPAAVRPRRQVPSG